jgi:hypothetical protein
VVTEKHLKIVARILDLAGQLFINAAKISASVEVIVVPVLRRLEIYPKEVQLKLNHNLTFTARGFDQQGDLMMLAISSGVQQVAYKFRW